MRSHMAVSDLKNKTTKINKTYKTINNMKTTKRRPDMKSRKSFSLIKDLQFFITRTSTCHKLNSIIYYLFFML